MTDRTTAVATRPVLHALLDEANRSGWGQRVLGVRARPQWDGPGTFDHDGQRVRVVACVSALAVREALLDRQGDERLVVLTDRDEDDLGVGLRSYLAWHRLRTPDPWEAIRQRFGARGLDPTLVAGKGHRDLATGLLAATPARGCPPAPGGVLTRDHAFHTVAATQLRLGAHEVIDTIAVLHWSLDPQATTHLADLRATGGDRLAADLIAWIAERCGSLGAPVSRLLTGGAAAELVPLGLIVGLLAEAEASGGRPDSASASSRQVAREARIRLEPRLGTAPISEQTARHWSSDAAAVVNALLGSQDRRPDAERTLAGTDALLRSVGAGALAAESEFLPAGLTARLSSFAVTTRAALDRLPRDVEALDAGQVEVLDAQWRHVQAHRLSGRDARLKPFTAAARLLRWLTWPDTVDGAGLAPLVRRHAGQDGWVDSAVNDAAAGVADPGLAEALAGVLALVRRRRDRHDREFAAALAEHTLRDPPPDSTGVRARHAGSRHLEDLLPDVVVPLARRTPVLLLVVDGMSCGVAAEVMSSVLGRADGWQEALLDGDDARGAALAVLPTLTRISRASLLCGEARVGEQRVEQDGFKRLAEAGRLPDAVLFHKRPLEGSRAGYAVADDVVAALEDVDGRPLVACVLNTVDDALDRSDPGGVDWRSENIKHLQPLLEVARHSGRIVIMTADHGHVIERRDGTQRPAAGMSSGRSRPAEPPPGPDEVLVTGRRVLDHGGRAVLAVDERLRYGPLKAGYHGGASPAEAVVPVCVLVPGAIPDGADLLRLAPPQEPPWWGTGGLAARREPAAAGTLFDVGPATAPRDDLASRVVASKTFRQQREIAARVPVTDEQVRRLLTALLAAADRRLAPNPAATALDVAPSQVRGAVLQVQRLLNVEGYPVLHFDADAITLVLDEALMVEQFQVRR